MVSDGTTRIEEVTNQLDQGLLTQFIDNPVEFLCANCADQISALPIWTSLYGEYIDGYMREDYGIRNLPALRIYNEEGTKEHESWFITGNLKADTILPTSIKRQEIQQVQDTIMGALIQQFRSMTFFQSVSAKVPGLNELGKVITWQKGMGMEIENEMCPVTQITLNFKLDQRIWDDYLTSEGRTKETPFAVTLANLQKIAYQINALKDDGTPGVNVPNPGASTIIIKGG